VERHRFLKRLQALRAALAGEVIVRFDQRHAAAKTAHVDPQTGFVVDVHLAPLHGEELLAHVLTQAR
jgi:predicted aconitase with swiveling domain